MEEKGKDSRTKFFKYYTKTSKLGFAICLVIIFLLLLMIISLQNSVGILSENYNYLQGRHSIMDNNSAMQQELNAAEKYKERIDQGTDIRLAYILLSDTDKLKEEIHKITNVSYTEDDTTIWLRAKDIYKWLGNNFEYCSDRVFKIGSVYNSLQFFSPDELLMYKLGIKACGDCDDYTHAFVGMMYASGIPKDQVRVEIGDHHVWPAIYIVGEDTWYDIDPICAQPDNFVDNTTIIFEQEFPDTPEDIRCVGRDPYSHMFAWYDYYRFYEI